MEFSQVAKNVKPSEIRKMFNKALEYDNVISFALGEPDFSASINVVKAGCEAIKNGYTKYSANAGILPLRECISDELMHSRKLKYSAKDEIVVTVGGMGALYLSMLCIINPGDEVIICTPYWTNYQQQVLLCGGTPVFADTKEENDFILDVDDLKKVITSKTKLLILNSPCNPTGGTLDAETLNKIAALAVKYDFYVISDEVYHKIVYDGYEHHSIAGMKGMKERTVLIDSFSKTYAMTGWRVGFAAAPQELAANITKLQEDVAACVTVPSQYAALEALKGSQEHLAYMVSQYQERRDYVAKRVNSISGLKCNIPKATFYMFINILGTKMKSDEFAMKLLEQKQVVVIPGTAFGTQGEGYIRLSFATSMEYLKKGLDLIEEFVSEG